MASLKKDEVWLFFLLKRRVAIHSTTIYYESLAYYDAEYHDRKNSLWHNHVTSKETAK